MSGAAKQCGTQPVLCVSSYSLALKMTCGFVLLGNVFINYILINGQCRDRLLSCSTFPQVVVVVFGVGFFVFC